MHILIFMKIRRIFTVVFFTILFFLLLITFSLNWTGDNFGGVGFDEIMFHLNMPLKGAGHSYFPSYFQKAFIPAIGIVAEMIVAIYLIKIVLSWYPKALERVKGIMRFWPIVGVIIICTWSILVVRRAQNWFGFLDYVKSYTEKSEFIENEYIDPRSVSIKFPDAKRNLIYIYVESGETSAQDVANGGLMPVNYIPELTEIAKNNISFSQSDLISGAAVPPLCGWTIAGMTAETAGVPLKLYNVHTSKVNNSMNQYTAYLPGVYSLGEILEDQGYKNYFMAGSDFEFGGRLDYCTQHGNYEIFDYNRAIEENVIPSDYYVWWGFEDKILFEWAKEKLVEIASKDEPFNFSLLTVDTHCQDGYICDLCQNEYSEPYANVWRCASRQIDDFVKWIQDQDFYENTTVIVAGDHCSMDRDFYGTYKYSSSKGEHVRKVYNAFINSAIEPLNEKNRLFTTLDLFPSTLASMGCEIEGNRLGLGVNLFSDEQTLAEKYGYDYMFDEMGKMSKFYVKELLYPEKK